MRAFAAAIILAMLSVPALAFDDPKTLVTAIYAPYQTPGAAAEQDPAQYYSERLKGLVSGHAAKAADNLLDGEGGGAGDRRCRSGPEFQSVHLTPSIRCCSTSPSASR